MVVHARHAQQRSRDAPSWNAIADVVSRLSSSSSLKIIGNGDVTSVRPFVKLHH